MKWSFLLIVVLSLLFACNKTKKEEAEKKLIPRLYLQATTNGLEKRNDIVFFNGKKFNGYVYEMNTKLDTSFVKSYLNGIEEGVHKSWYSNTQLAEERWFHLGKKVGTHRAWWENGILQTEYQIDNDEYVGTFKEWNREGRLVKVFNYKNGQEEGSQKLFYDNGSISSNYVIVKGRRYGLLGTKNCKNVKNNTVH